jgi:hypothetical protein
VVTSSPLPQAAPRLRPQDERSCAGHDAPGTADSLFPADAGGRAAVAPQFSTGGVVVNDRGEMIVIVPAQWAADGSKVLALPKDHWHGSETDGCRQLARGQVEARSRALEAGEASTCGSNPGTPTATVRADASGSIPAPERLGPGHLTCVIGTIYLFWSGCGSL